MRVTEASECWGMYHVVDSDGKPVDKKRFRYYADACEHMGKLIAEKALKETKPND